MMRVIEEVWQQVFVPLLLENNEKHLGGTMKNCAQRKIYRNE
jgi:hypothetical protein